MVTDTSAELAEAMGAPAEELVALQRADADGVDGLGLVYQVSDPDKESWRPAWKMEVGFDGVEYGKPIKLPKNVNALASYLAKRRKDGGRLFTLRMPAHILGPGDFECFVAPNDCNKRAPTKGLLVDHMEGCHPNECRHYAPFIQQIRDSIAAENPALQAMVDKIAGTPDRQSVVVPEEVRGAHDETVPEIAPAPAPQVFSASFVCQAEGCKDGPDGGPWQPKPSTARPELARRLHMQAKHPQEVA